MYTEGGHIGRLTERAQQQIQYGDLHGAVETLREALSAAPDDPFLHSLLSLVLIDLKRRHAGLHEAKLGLSTGPDMPFCHFVLGNAYMAHQKYKPAMTHLQEAIALDPETAAYQIAVGRASMRIGRRREARAFFEQAIEIDPENPDGFTALGKWFRDDRKMDRAEACFKQALEIDPGYDAALVQMGHILLSRGEIEAARDHAIWVLQQDANDAGALVLLSGIKTRTNPFLGIWWRFNSWLVSGGNTRMILILVLGYALFRVGSLMFGTFGYDSLSDSVRYVWLAIVIYSWVGPFWFNNAVRKELETVDLKPEF